MSVPTTTGQHYPPLTAPPSPLALDDLTDVNAPAPNDGDALIWNDGAALWEAAPITPTSGTGDTFFFQGRFT